MLVKPIARKKLGGGGEMLLQAGRSWVKIQNDRGRLVVMGRDREGPASRVRLQQGTVSTSVADTERMLFCKHIQAP